MSKNNLHFSNIASDQVIQVFNNTDWNTTNSATWLTLSPNNTSGNRNVTISVTANTNSTSRFATVTFTAGDIKQILYIKQDSVTLGVEKQNNLENISIYPNPSNGIFIIDFKYLTGKKIITVYDNKGVLIINTTTENITFPLDLSGFRKGIYSINVLNENNILTLKILNK